MPIHSALASKLRLLEGLTSFEVAMADPAQRALASAGGEDAVLAELDGRYWAFEVAKSFTGRVVGLYAVDGTVAFRDYRYDGDDTRETQP